MIYYQPHVSMECSSYHSTKYLKQIVEFLLFIATVFQASKSRSTFLSDPSPIIGNASHSLTNWLPNSRLVNLIDVTLACEDGNSKLVEIVTLADVDTEDHVGNSLLIWVLEFVQHFDVDTEDHVVNIFLN